jgi:hypothetical protein
MVPAISPNRATVVITSMDVTSEAVGATGNSQTIIFHLRETGGVGATIAAVDFMLGNGSASADTSHINSPMTDSANRLPPYGTADSRRLTANDVTGRFPYPTSVQANVSFSDDKGNTGMASGSTNVPPLPSPSQATVTGTVTDATYGGVVPNITVKATDAAHAGKVATTNSMGSYSMTGVATGDLTLSASASGYQTSTKTATVTGDTQIDFMVLPTGPGTTPAGPSGPIL